VEEDATPTTMFAIDKQTLLYILIGQVEWVQSSQVFL